jgi:tRNA/rRNA methyltransferase
LNKKARILAHASTDILEKAKVYISLNEVVQDFDFLIATSAKRRRTHENYMPADGLPDFIRNKSNSLIRIGILFGREESGLSNEEIRICDIVSFVPMAVPYPSLNLSQAVMIYAYLLSGIFRKEQNKKGEKYPEENLRVLKKKVRRILDETMIKQPHIIGPRIMERMSFLKKEDISLLHSVCNAFLEKNN